MTSFDLPVIFSLVAHELRSPASVIAGCARMLNEGRLNEEDRRRVYGQIERAATRVTTMCQQSSEVARWLRPSPSPIPTSPLSLHLLLTSALAQSAVSRRVTLDEATGAAMDDVSIPALDRGSLVMALSAMFDFVGREVPDGQVGVTVRTDQPVTSCVILIGPVDALVGPAAPGPEDAITDQLSLDAGGMGLALVVSAAVIAAHGGQVLTFSNHRNVVGARLRAQREL